jgi:hypothetical protein
LKNRLIQQGDSLRWTPKAGVESSVQQAFEMIGWDDGSEPVPREGSVPSLVKDVVSRTTDVTGALNIEWASSEEQVSSYAVRVTSESRSQTYSTTTTSLTLQDLPTGVDHEIEVWATNENGSGEIAKVSAALPKLRLGERINQFWHLNQNLLPTDPVDDLGVPLVPANSTWGNSVAFPGVSYDAIMASSETNPAEVPVLILPNEVITEADVDNGMTMSMWVQARGPGMLLSADYTTPSGVVTLPYMWIAPSGKVFAGFYNSESEYLESNSSIISWPDPSTGENRIGSMQSIESLVSVIDGSWHQITFVVRGSKQALYVDGLLQGENFSTVDMQETCSEDGWAYSNEQWTYSVPLSSIPKEAGVLNLNIFQGVNSEGSKAASNTYNGAGLVPRVVQAGSETYSQPLSLAATNLVYGSNSTNYTTISSAHVVSTAEGYSLQVSVNSKPSDTMPLRLAISYLPENSQPFSVTPRSISADSFQPNSAVVGKSIFPFIDGNNAPQTNYPQPYRGAIAELATWSEELSSVDIQAITTVPVLDAIAGAVFHDGGVITPLSSPDALYTFEMSDGDSAPNISPNGNAGAATAKGLVTGNKSTIPTPFANIQRLPQYQPFGLGLMAPLATGEFSISPPAGNNSTQTIERQVALAVGDQLTLQRSNINTNPALVLSIADDLGQTILAPSAFLDQAASTDQLYTLVAPRTGTYKITVEWPVGENGQNAGNYQPIQIMYSMTPGSQNSFQSLFASFKELFVHEGDVLATYSSPGIPSVNSSSNQNTSAADATGAANYFPLWSDTRYFPASTGYTTVDLSQAFVDLQGQVGYAIADLNGGQPRLPTELQSDLQTAYQELTSNPPVGLNLDALNVVNQFFVDVNTYRETVYEALSEVWTALQDSATGITKAVDIANTISTNQAHFVVDENAGPPNINPSPKNFGVLFGESIEKLALKVGIMTALRAGGPVTKSAAVLTVLGIEGVASAKKAGKGSTTQNSVLVNLLPVMNSQVIYEELNTLGESIDSNVINAFSHQASQLKNPVYLNSIYSNYGLLELMGGMSGASYNTNTAQDSFTNAAEELATAQAWSQMVPDVFTWTSVAPENLPVNNYNFAQLPLSSVSWEAAGPNVPSGTSANDATWLATGDLNGDFYPDIVTSNNGSSSISVLLAQPSPEWNAATPAVGYDASDPGWTYTNVYGESSTVSTDATDPSGIAVADFDGDGQNEILVGSISNSSLYVIEVETTSTSIAFGTQTEIGLNGGEQPQQVTVADFNQDGKPDFVTACQDGNNLVYGLNQFTENPSTPFNVSSPGDMKANNNVRWVTAGDLTGDDFPDLVSISYEQGGYNTIYAEVWVNQGNTGSNFNGFANPSSATNTTFEVRNSHLMNEIMATNAVIGDFDGDGYVDDFAFGMNPTNSQPNNYSSKSNGMVQFVYGSSSGPTNWQSEVDTSNSETFLYENEYVVQSGDPSYTNSEGQVVKQTNTICSLAVLPSDQLPGVGADVVIASYGELGQWFVTQQTVNSEAGLKFMSLSGSSGSQKLPSGTSPTTSQIVVDSETGLIAAVSGSPATVAFTTLQAAGVTDSTVALMGTDYAGLNMQAFDGLSSLGGTSDSVEFNLEVQALLQQLQSGKFVNIGPRESAGIGAPGFFVGAVDVSGEYLNGLNESKSIPSGSMAFVAWNLVDENGNPIALETLDDLVGNISPTQKDSESAPTIRPYLWQAQDLNPIDPLQPAMAYNGGWFAAVEPFNNAPATYGEMFFEWGRDVSGYAPNSISGTASGLNYSPATRSPMRLAISSAPRNLTATPTNQTELNVSWSAPEDVYGGSETVVTYEVTLTQNGVDFTPITTTDLSANFVGLLLGNSYTVTVLPKTQYGDGTPASLTQVYPV